jgi:Leucine-rich repeat (LRR) protein
VIKKFSNLEYLDVSKNYLKNVDDLWSEELEKKLKVLNLAYNLIENIPEEKYFIGLDTLEL